MRYDPSIKNALIDEHMHGFRVNLKPEKKSKLSSVVLKIRGIDQVCTAENVLYSVSSMVNSNDRKLETCLFICQSILMGD